MHTSDDSTLASDADTAIRAAAICVLQGTASGLTKAEILEELAQKKVYLPDPEEFIDAVIAANAKGPGEGAAAQTGATAGASEPTTRPEWLTGIGAFAAALAPAWIVCLLLWKFAAAIAPVGGIIGGMAAGLALTFFVKEKEPEALFFGAFLGSVAFLLSAIAAAFLLR